MKAEAGLSRILITGAGGFVGKHLISELRDRGQIYGLHHPKVDVSHIKNIELYPCDITESQRLYSLLDFINPDYIVHLAAIAFVPHSARNPLYTWDVNLYASLSILEWMRKRSPETKALFISTSEIYGEPVSLPMDESHPIAPNNVYAATKASLDIATGQYRRAHGLNIVTARPFNHTGPGQSDNFVVSSFAKQVAEVVLEKKEPIIRVGNLKAKRDFTDVRDVVKAYSKLLFDALSDTYNICSGRPQSIQYLLDGLINCSGKELKVETDPERMRRIDVPEVRGSFDKLASVTGWGPTIAIEKTLEDTLSYWIEILNE